MIIIIVPQIRFTFATTNPSVKLTPKKGLRGRPDASQLLYFMDLLPVLYAEVLVQRLTTKQAMHSAQLVLQS